MKRHGFTLIELLVTIVIILILLGIGAGVGSWASRSGEEQLTATTLVNLRLLLEEYTNSGGNISTNNTTMLIMVDIRNNRRALKEKYFPGLPDNLLGKDSNNDGDVNDANEFSVWDAWGKEIYFNRDGKTSPSGATLPLKSSPYFASAGPDGKWGSVVPLPSSPTAAQLQASKEAGDNLYSFEMTR